MTPLKSLMVLAFAAISTPFFSTPLFSTPLFSTTLVAQEAAATLTPAEQFELIRSWEGRWKVAETSALEIVFESTARGSTMVERWETQSGLHSITVYHLDGDALLATHYCPQGNQPRLEAHVGEQGEIRFEFRDVTDLGEGESHTHDLWFTPGADGTIRRSEIYLGNEGLQEPGHYTLSRVASGD